MSRRTLLRSALELRTSTSTRLPPTFLLPFRARYLSTTSTHQQPATTEAIKEHTSPTKTSIPAPEASAVSSLSGSTPDTYRHPSRKPPPPTAQAPGTVTKRRQAPLKAPPPLNKGPLPETVKALLPLLRAQPNQYITVHIHGRPYLVTPGDSIRLPFLMPGVAPGDVLRLNRASVLGSRDLTLRPADPSARKAVTFEQPYVDDRLFECRATVVGVVSEPMREKKKTKRRNRKVKTVKTKLRYTVLRISELKIKLPEEVEEEEAARVE